MVVYIILDSINWRRGVTRIPEHFTVWSIVGLIRVLDSSIKKEPIFRVRAVKWNNYVSVLVNPSSFALALMFQENKLRLD